MSKPKDQAQDAAEGANANPPVRHDQTDAAPETPMDDQEPVDEDSDDVDQDVRAPGETRAPELPGETLAGRVGARGPPFRNLPAQEALDQPNEVLRE